MKIDKNNPLHWFYLAITTINVFIAIILVRIFGLIRKKRIILYGHKLNGNLKGFYDYVIEKQQDTKIQFLTMDPVYYLNNRAKYRLALSLNPVSVINAARTKTWITDHGLHSFQFFQQYLPIKFVDVWHGIPFKGFDEEDFRHLHDYEQVWVTSKSMKEMYINKFGFKPEQIRVTGYARTDSLVNNEYNKSELIEKYKVSGYKKIVLIAPTWKQDNQGRSIIPFDTPISRFFEELNSVARQNETLIIFRAHLNSNELNDLEDLEDLENIRIMSYEKYPLAEEFLFISDILVSDWSSIVFDYLPLKRPTIFLDVDAPFAKGFSYGPEYRFGKIVENFEELIKSLNIYLIDPKSYSIEFQDKLDKIIVELYDNNLDGKSAERGYKYLKSLLKS